MHFQLKTQMLEKIFNLCQVLWTSVIQLRTIVSKKTVDKKALRKAFLMPILF